MYLTHVTFELGKITDWLTAIGTVGAVAWALFLARQQGSEQLRIASILRDQQIMVVLFNAGTQLVVITDATIKIGRIRPAEEPSLRAIWGSSVYPRLISPGAEYLTNLDLS